MEKNLNVEYPNLIRTFRNLNGMSLQEVSDELKNKDISTSIDVEKLSDYEKGINLPDGKTLFALADIFKTDIDWLLMPPLDMKLTFRTIEDDDNDPKDEDELHTFLENDESNYRNRELLNSIKEVGKIYIKYYLFFEKICNKYSKFVDNPIKSDKIESRKDVFDACKKLREMLKIGDGRIESVFETLSSKNIKILELDIDINYNYFKGMSSKENYFILVNKNIAIESQRFTILHELGHLLLNFEGFDENKQEKLCNTFASNMLFPNNKFEEAFAFAQNVDNFDIFKDDNFVFLAKMQKEYGISVRSIGYKLYNRDYISKDKHNEFLEKIEKEEYKKIIKKYRFTVEDKVKNDTKYKLDKLLALTEKAYKQEEISYSKFLCLVDLITNYSHLVKNLKRNI